MHILVSNDDGYSAQGIMALARTMRHFGKVSVVAPHHNQSGASNSLTLTAPLSVLKISDDIHAVTGTPSDSVHLAMTGLLSEPPDLIVSGINCGQNMGEDVMYSGTVAAAMEGYLSGVDAIAFSQVQRGWEYLDDACEVAKRIVEQFLAAKTNSTPRLWNVNIPNLPIDQIKDIVPTRLGRRHPAQPMIREMSPRGFPIYWIGPCGQARDRAEGTDFYAVEQNCVSVTPLQVDLTHYSALNQLKLAL